MAIYERNMKITYTGDFVDDKHIEKKLQDRLHRIFGLSQVGGYFWRSFVEDENYGYQDTEKSKTVYTVTIDNKDAFVTTYFSDAKLAVDQMIENDFDADLKEVTTTEKFKEWKEVNGKYFFTSTETIDGDFKSSPLPCLRYNDNLIMITSFTHEYGDFILKFNIQYSADKITARKSTEKMLVEVPLNDMRYFRSAIEDCLNLLLESGEIEHVIDCTGCIKSESTHECSSETVGMVMTDE